MNISETNAVVNLYDLTVFLFFWTWLDWKHNEENEEEFTVESDSQLKEVLFPDQDMDAPTWSGYI
jgi:hypothetical protein